MVTVAGAAGDRVFLQNMNTFSVHLPVANKEARRRESGQAGTDNIGGFTVNSLGLFRACKGFIVSAGIIHHLASIFRYCIFCLHYSV